MFAKKSLKNLLLLPVCLAALSGCVSRDEADSKLALGCAAGAEVFLEEGYSIKKIVKSTFNDSKEFGKGYREVRLDVLESDGWYDAEKSYECLFGESYRFAGIGYKASIDKLKIDDQIYGKMDGKLFGSFNDHLKLTQAVDQMLSR